MEKPSRSSLAELKVGLFVVLACLVLAVAIFTIGTQVGLLEETFLAKTYLNNVSGLKPGDIVLLGGVEVGNVESVHISPAGELPPTQANQRILEDIQELTSQLQVEQTLLATAQTEETRLESSYQSAAGAQGREAPAVRALADRLEDQQRLVDSLERSVENLQDDVDESRAKLQNIVIYMRIGSDYRGWIRNDSNISLGSVGLLGDRYIEISLGRTDVPPPVVTESFDAWIGTEDKEVVLITGTTQAGFQELITGANDILANFETLSGKLNEIMETFQEGEGTVGKFFRDPAFYNNLNQAVLGARTATAQATSLMQDITEGPGTVPRLIQEREVYDNIEAATRRLEGVLARIEQGDGTVGRLMNDPALFRRSEEALTNLRDITQRLQAGEGTIGRLMTEDKLHQDLTQTVETLSKFLQGLEQGRGTLGRLAHDDALYQNLNEATSEVVKLIYDFRQNPRKFLTIKFEIF